MPFCLVCVIICLYWCLSVLLVCVIICLYWCLSVLLVCVIICLYWCLPFCLLCNVISTCGCLSVSLACIVICINTAPSHVCVTVGRPDTDLASTYRASSRWWWSTVRQMMMSCASTACRLSSRLSGAAPRRCRPSSPRSVTPPFTLVAEKYQEGGRRGGGGNVAGEGILMKEGKKSIGLL